MKITNEQLQSLSEIRKDLIQVHIETEQAIIFSQIKKLDNLIEELLLAQKEEKLKE